MILDGHRMTDENIVNDVSIMNSHRGGCIELRRGMICEVNDITRFFFNMFLEEWIPMNICYVF